MDIPRNMYVSKYMSIGSRRLLVIKFITVAVREIQIAGDDEEKDGWPYYKESGSIDEYGTYLRQRER